MNKKNILVLIIENQPLQRLHIEKTLNSLGYFRIQPLNSFDEAATIIYFATTPVDLVILNASCLSEQNDDSMNCLIQRRNFRHALIYGEQKFNLMRYGVSTLVSFLDAALPDYLSICSLMDSVNSTPEQNHIEHSQVQKH
ncbi:hypothetical protein [Pseudomonas koreensis]|uniref:hypothetical protein n=1 Tax=Pseudomonas koreensis TaxID=198620 RepID=UPI001245EC4F|nr:hypothetical protein [Pseudomonas koreensis]KAB0507599.1 hypothetical protein F7R05_28640 [Pseudomonas koreensis]NNA64936.1 hypothetical protein [Pseudomonas koreensis]GGK53497.1 hypothetical protein GCM10009103_54740 [Pseudomonas koreensis]